MYGNNYLISVLSRYQKKGPENNGEAGSDGYLRVDLVVSCPMNNYDY